MPPEKRDPAYLWDMLEAARNVRDMSRNATFDEYLRNLMLRLAVERAIEIIGEAARHVSLQFQQAHPEIPWKPIMGQRHVLAHDYGDIDDVSIWNVVTVDIPRLIARLEPLIPPLPPSVDE